MMISIRTIINTAKTKYIAHVVDLKPGEMENHIEINENYLNLI